MQGRISALEITVSESQLFEAFKDAGLLDEDGDYPGDSLDDLGSPEQTYNEDSYSYWINAKGEMTVTRELTERVEMDSEVVETHYRGSYLASLSTGDVEQPGLCSMQKYREYRKENGQSEGEFKFAYLEAESTLEFVKYNEHLHREVAQLQIALDSRQRELAEVRLLLEQARGERDAARDERDTMAETGSDLGVRIGELLVEKNNLEERLQGAAADADENRQMRQRVFQLEAGGEQIDAWIRGDGSHEDIVSSIENLLASVGGPWTRQDDEG